MNNNKPVTILETMYNMNNKHFIQEINHCNDNYKRKDKWNKYIDKLDNIILNKLESMCLVERNNVCRKYASNINNSYIIFEYRFKGIPTKSECSIKYVVDNKVMYHNITDTPKHLYKSFIQSI
jgi:hypothetical protein